MSLTEGLCAHLPGRLFRTIRTMCHHAIPYGSDRYTPQCRPNLKFWLNIALLLPVYPPKLLDLFSRTGCSYVLLGPVGLLPRASFSASSLFFFACCEMPSFQKSRPRRLAALFGRALTAAFSAASLVIFVTLLSWYYDKKNAQAVRGNDSSVYKYLPIAGVSTLVPATRVPCHLT